MKKTYSLIALLCLILFCLRVQAENTKIIKQEVLDSMAEVFFETGVSLGSKDASVYTERELQVLEKTADKLYPVVFSDTPEETIGYIFESQEFIEVFGFSGSSMNVLLAIDAQGVFRGVEMLEHNEPIFYHGLGVQSLLDFLNQYKGKKFNSPLSLLSPGEEITSNFQVEAVSRATASSIAINKTITLGSLKALASKFSLSEQKQRGEVKQDYFEALTIEQMLDKGLVQKQSLDTETFIKDMEAQGKYYDAEDFPSDEFVNLYFGLVSMPIIGKNLLEEADYQRLTDQLKPGQHVIAVFSRGEFGIRDENFVRGTSPASLELIQDELPIAMKDLDFFDNRNPQSAYLGSFSDQLMLLGIDSNSLFDASNPWQLKLIIEPQESYFLGQKPRLEYLYEYSLPQDLFIYHQFVDENTPVWQLAWNSRVVDIGIVIVYLLLVLIIFFFQHEIVKILPMKKLRLGMLFFLLFYIGFYLQGQLSVVNILTIVQSWINGFQLEVFLLDPIIFILWIFTFITLFLWGRGVFCGWLCPFGALQELLFIAGKKLKLKSIKIPEHIHKRLWSLKYIILFGLVFLSLFSLHKAEQFSEVEPFKTVITYYFVSDFMFVAYAIILLALGVFIHKFYCRYICPLGAGLALLGKFRQFEWLSRRSECGSCKMCANNCEIRAIEKSGKVNYNECIQCFECIDIYHNSCAVTLQEQKNNIPITNLTTYHS